MQSDTLSKWKADLANRLHALASQQQRRSLTVLSGANFCSNDYLGLAKNPELRAAVSRAVQNASSVGGTGSRLLSGHAPEWQELEERFAKFAGTEAALFFGSGYAANIGVLPSLVGRDDVVYSDVLNHASLIDGIRLSGARKVIYPHLHLGVLEESLRQDAGSPGRRILVTESIFSMNGDVAPLQEMAVLAKKYDAAMIIDEAHATGVHGEGGRGLAAHEGVRGQVLAAIHTCGKALASAGAFVCGAQELKEHLINHARTFIFSTALPPYFAGQIDAALTLAQGLEAERRTLLQCARWLIQALQEAGFDTAGSASQIVPVILGSNKDALEAAEQLQREGFAVRAIRPPTVPEGSARLRLSLTASITEDELQRLVKTLVAWREARVMTMAAGRA